MNSSGLSEIAVRLSPTRTKLYNIYIINLWKPSLAAAAGALWVRCPLDHRQLFQLLRTTEVHPLDALDGSQWAEK